MADSIFSGLEAFGFKNLDGLDIFESEKKQETAAQETAVPAKPQPTEKDFLLDKTFDCLVCGTKFKTRAVKASSAKLVGTDRDLRPRHEFIDVTKYDAIMCPMCGYTALSRFFNTLLDMQRRNIKEKVLPNFRMRPSAGDVFSYDEAIERYKMALLNAVVKGAKNSEKAYICLKASWMYRGKAEEVGENDPSYKELKATELEFTRKAYEGFNAAVGAENFPMCGMDESTVDYLIANLAFMTDHVDVCSKMIAKILASVSASPRIKDKTRDLKEEVLKKLKNKQ